MPHRSWPAANATDGPAELAPRADIAEHVQLLLVFAAHAFFLTGCLVETREYCGTGSVAAKRPHRPIVTLNGKAAHGSLTT